MSQLLSASSFQVDRITTVDFFLFKTFKNSYFYTESGYKIISDCHFFFFWLRFIALVFLSKDFFNT